MHWRVKPKVLTIFKIWGDVAHIKACKAPAIIPALMASVRCVSGKAQVSIEDPISRSTNCIATYRE
jgi:hypothetical protein